ncbi:MAG: branched-chain amino acid ABC transporter permease [Desulfobacteraceae bacterium]|nr:branched-chain amino acid ABC transporter permease [Desulfobacteraceae bacterium]
MWALENIIIYGLCMGAIYLLIAMGFSIICGVLRIFHLGYAYIFPLTIYVTWAFMQEVGFSFGWALAAMVIVQFALGAAIYRGLIRPYFEKEEILFTGLLLIALIVEKISNYFYPPQAGVYIPSTIMEGTTQIGHVYMPAQFVAGGIIALVLTGLFILFFLKTRIGMGIRALSQGIYESKIVGINIEGLYYFTMLLVLVPVIIGTLIIAPVWAVDPQMGWLYMNTAILVSVIGGLGNLRGTIIASFLVGFVHAAMCFVIGEPRLMGAAGMALAVVILVVKPTGLTRSETLW